MEQGDKQREAAIKQAGDQCLEFGVSDYVLESLYDAGHDAGYSARSDRIEALSDLLTRISQWDMLDTAADGQYWKAEIEAALSPLEEQEGGK